MLGGTPVAVVDPVVLPEMLGTIADDDQLFTGLCFLCIGECLAISGMSDRPRFIQVAQVGNPFVGTTMSRTAAHDDNRRQRAAHQFEPNYAAPASATRIQRSPFNNDEIQNAAC